MLSISQETHAQDQGSNESEIMPELVSKVAERVYQLLFEEARIERERRRPSGGGAHFGQGGH